MKYYKTTKGEVYAYDTEAEREKYGSPELEEMTDAEIDYHLNSPLPAQYKTRFSVLEFRDRFTLPEQLAIRQAQLQDMEVGLVYDNFQAAQYIDLEDPRVSAGLDLYEAKGLLEAGRKEELLTPEIIQP